MTGAVILALLGMGVLASTMFLDDSSDSDEDQGTGEGGSQDSVEQSALQPDAFDTMLETNDAETVSVPQDGHQTDAPTVIHDFDGKNDILAINLKTLISENMESSGGTGFSDDADLAYTLEHEFDADTDATLVQFEMVDLSDPDAGSANLTVRLDGVADLDPFQISIVTGENDLSDLAGGERVSVIKGSPNDDTVALSDTADVVQTGDGDDIVSGSENDAVILAGAGEDTVDITGQNLDVFGGSGDDHITITCEDHEGASSSDIFGGDGADLIRLELGSDASGGAGADDITVSVEDTPLDAQPLFLWNQPVEDARFAAHSEIQLDDDEDTIRLDFDENIPGHLHHVRLSQESFGLSSQEVYLHEYSLIIWSPEGVTDISDLVQGYDSAFNTGLADTTEIGDEEYESAALDPEAPRVILTIYHGESFSGEFDELTGATTGAYDAIHEANLQINRALTSAHHSAIF